MLENPYVLMFSIFLGLAGFAYAIWYFWVRPELEAKEQAATQAALQSEPTLLLKPAENVVEPGFAGKMDSSFKNLIDRTGLGIDVPTALALMLLSGVVLGTLVYFWRQDEEPWLAFPAFVVGAILPLVFFVWRKHYWVKLLRSQLPDAFFLLSRSMRAGRSLEQSFQLVGEQSVAPLSSEFSQMSKQLDLGLPLGQLLESASRRLNLVDFNIFSALVNLHRPMGGNLPSVLDRMASSTRERIQADGQYESATVLGRYSAFFIVLMVGIVLMYQFFSESRVALRFFESNVGITLFLVAMGFVLGGAILLWGLLRTDKRV